MVSDRLNQGVLPEQFLTDFFYLRLAGPGLDGGGHTGGMSGGKTGAHHPDRGEGNLIGGHGAACAVKVFQLNGP